MKAFVSIAATALAYAAYGFDPDAWLSKRAALGREAERVRALYLTAAECAGIPVEGLEVPLKLRDDGSPQATLWAERAKLVRDLHCVRAEDVTVVFHGDGGAEEGRATVSGGVVETLSKEDVSAWVEGHAKVEAKGVTLEGDGMFFSPPEGWVKIASNVKVVARDVEIGTSAADIAGLSKKKRKGGSK